MGKEVLIMSKIFTINEKKYTSKPFDFNMVCDLEDLGISIADLGKKQTAFLRAYFSLCANVDLNVAGKEIETHIIQGGNLDELMKAVEFEIDESDFFRHLQTTETEKNQEDTIKEKKTK